MLTSASRWNFKGSTMATILLHTFDAWPSDTEEVQYGTPRYWLIAIYHEIREQSKAWLFAGTMVARSSSVQVTALCESQPSPNFVHACGEVTGCVPATKRSACIALEVDLRECTLHSPLQKVNNARTHSELWDPEEMSIWNIQNRGTSAAPPPSNYTCPPKTLKKMKIRELFQI